MQSNHEIAVINFGDDSGIDTVLKVFDGQHLPRTIANYKNPWSQKFVEINSSAIVILDSIESIKNFNEKSVLTNDFYKPFQFVMFCPSATADEISRLEETKKNIERLQFEYFLFKDQTHYRLMTFVWHTLEKCNELQLVEVNSFSMATNQWAHDQFKIEKFNNFHGCWLRFMFEEKSFGYTPLMRNVNRIKETVECQGYICEIAKAIGPNLNLKYRSNFYDVYEQRYFFRNNKFDTDWDPVSLIVTYRFKKKVLDGHKRIAEFFYSPQVMSENHYMTIPPPQSYNTYEKLLLPFDHPTWYWIAATFTLAFVTTNIVFYFAPKLKTLISGPEETSAGLNILRLFFGDSVVREPEENFARITLMTFILFSLVMRIAYQGKMFEFLQKDVKKPTVSSLEEMIAKNFTFVMQYGFKLEFPDLNLAKKGNIMEVRDYRYLDQVINDSYRSDSKFAFALASESLAFFNKRYMKQKKIITLADPFIIDTTVFRMFRTNKLYETICRKIHQLFEADLINFSTRQFFDATDPKKFEEYVPPYKILTLEELEAGFVVWMISLLFSLVAFTFETLIKPFIMLVICLKSGIQKCASCSKNKFSKWKAQSCTRK